MSHLFHTEFFVSSGFLLTISLVSQDFQAPAETKKVPSGDHLEKIYRRKSSLDKWLRFNTEYSLLARMGSGKSECLQVRCHTQRSFADLCMRRKRMNISKENRFFFSLQMLYLCRIRCLSVKVKTFFFFNSWNIIVPNCELSLCIVSSDLDHILHWNHLVVWSPL